MAFTSRKSANLLKKIEKIGFKIDIMEAPLELKACDLPFDCPSQPDGFDPTKDVVKVQQDEKYLSARGWYTVTPVEEDQPFIDPTTKLSLHPPTLCCPECPSATHCLVKPPPRLFNVSRAIAHIQDYIETHGPYVGIIGFSQGGCMANSLLFASDNILDVSWIISVASNVIGGDLMPQSRGTDGALRLREQNLTTPLLLITGSKDEHVPSALTLECKKHWAPDAEVLTHDGGHCMPQKSAHIAVILDFIRKHSGLL